MPAEIIESRIVLAAEPLCELAQSILERVGVPSPKAQLVAASLVASNLRGVDSHGVQLLPYYVEQIEWGDLNPHANGHVVSANNTSMVYDGENACSVREVC